jgi:hypothetical protein
MRNGYLVGPFVLAVTFLSLSLEAKAQLSVFREEAPFLAMAGDVQLEGFEQLAPRLRSTAPVTVPAFTITPTPGLLAVMDGPNNPENSFGASATEGTKFLFTYRENEVAGTLQIDLSAPTTAFGFNVMDWGDGAVGSLTLTTNAGESQTPQTILEAPPFLSDGNTAFFGIVQSTPFTQVFITSNAVDDAFGIDKVYLRPVPAPGALLTVLLGAVPGICALRRRALRRVGRC